MKRQQKHAYDPAEIESLKGIPVPEKIKCGRCAKNLPHLKYSTKQLTDFRHQVKTQGRITKPIKCHSCAGGQQVVELECVVCHKTKGLEEFAKSQRAKPDTARCERCTKELVEQKPIDHHAYALGVKTFRTPDHVNGYTPNPYSSADSTSGSEAIVAQWENWQSHQTRTEDDTESLSSDFKRAVSVKGSTHGVLIDSDVSVSGHSTDKEEWKRVKSDKSWRTPSTGSTATSYGGSMHSYASSIAERSTGRSGGWARIPAYRPDSPPTGGAVMMPHGDAQREVNASCWDSDGESSEGETCDDDDDSDGEYTVI